MQVTLSGLKPTHYVSGGPLSTAAEWLMFSTCKYYIMPQSGYSKTAFGFSMTHPVPFLFTRYGYGGGKETCDPSSPSPMADFQIWSGL